MDRYQDSLTNDEKPISKKRTDRDTEEQQKVFVANLKNKEGAKVKIFTNQLTYRPDAKVMT